MRSAEDQMILKDFQEPESRNRALAQLIEKYQKRLYWHIRKIVIAHEDTDDVLQNTFIKVWRALENFKGIARCTHGSTGLLPMRHLIF